MQVADAGERSGESELFSKCTKARAIWQTEVVAAARSTVAAISITGHGQAGFSTGRRECAPEVQCGWR